ncbi:ATP-binding protein [Bacillus salipaludis]|uniref:histidine kinase n=1 Tax=Bacillus salipaludis TaxID=2547811 RepID=A0A4R5VU24_9BACI|nr:sensor histidine kinase [Bacillus salipaludis]MDQ6600482.1 sensor histidine kinase [Bacillus salipaludis]TDK62123.1 ATP-binding protein [Bacillus salipaludis]
MKRALINLLGNAIRYAETRIVVRSFLAEQQVIVEVKDDGVGLAPGGEEKIFQRFYSGDAGGSGIGLAISKRLLKGIRGPSMRLTESQKERCSRLKFRFYYFPKKGLNQRFRSLSFL